MAACSCIYRQRRFDSLFGCWTTPYACNIVNGNEWEWSTAQHQANLKTTGLEPTLLSIQMLLLRYRYESIGLGVSCIARHYPDYTTTVATFLVSSSLSVVSWAVSAQGDERIELYSRRRRDATPFPTVAH